MTPTKQYNAVYKLFWFCPWPTGLADISERHQIPEAGKDIVGDEIEVVSDIT